MKKSRYGTRDAAGNWERDWQEHVKKWCFQLGLSSKNPLHYKENRVSGLTHGDDFVLTGPTKKLMEFEKKMTSGCPIKAKILSYGSPKSIKTLNRRLAFYDRLAQSLLALAPHLRVNFSIFQFSNFSSFDSIHHDALQILLSLNFPNFPTFDHPSRRSRPCHY